MATLTMPQLQGKMRTWLAKGTRAAKRTLDREMMLVVAEAQEMHLSGPKMRTGQPHPTLATLAVQTGRLRGSVTFRKTTKKHYELISGIGTNVPYGKVHEFGLMSGGVKMPERPWARPSIEARKGFIIKALLKTFMREYRRA